MMEWKEVLTLLDDSLDQSVVETFIDREWVKPKKKNKQWMFEEIDVARIRLIHTLHKEYAIEEEAMDVILPLLDQVYGLREQMRLLTRAIEKQPRRVQAEIFTYLSEDKS